MAGKKIKPGGAIGAKRYGSAKPARQKAAKLQRPYRRGPKG